MGDPSFVTLSKTGKRDIVTGVGANAGTTKLAILARHRDSR
jgi:hypothetical protein